MATTPSCFGVEMIFYLIFAIPALLIELAVWIVDTFRPVIESVGILIIVATALLSVAALAGMATLASIIFRASRRWFAILAGVLVVLAGSAVATGLAFIAFITSVAVALLHSTA